MAQVAGSADTGRRDQDAGRRDQDTGRRDQVVFAVILIVVGVMALVSQVLEPDTNVGGWVVAIIGLGLLGAFAYTRQYGYLVPGGILTGLGLGIVASEAFQFASDEGKGGAVVLGLGMGFLSVWVIGALARVPRNHWWPIVPGGILATVGSALLIGDEAVDLLEYWGVVAIAIGLFVLWRAWTEASSRT